MLARTAKERHVRRLVLVLGMLAALSASAKVKVVATLTDLGDIAKQVGGDQVDVTVLARSTQDPHFVDAKPSLVLDLAHANLLLLNGMELEVGWLPALMTASRNGEIQVGSPGYLDCSTLITPKEVPMQKLDRAMGDIHPGGNPHYTKDPRNALKVAEGIAARLAELDQPHAAAYKANAAKFESALKAKISAWESALAPYKGQPVVTYHKSWIYFVDWAGLTEVAFIEPKPGIPPNPAHVANVLTVIKQRNVPIILQEQWYSAATSELLARNSGATVVRVPGMTPENGTYIGEMDTLVSEVVKALAQHKS